MEFLKNSLKRSQYKVESEHKGSIFIITLWAICLLTIFAVSLNDGTRQKILIIKRLEAKCKLRSVSSAGIKTMIAFFLNYPNRVEDMYLSNDVQDFKNVIVGEGTFSICYEDIDEISGDKTIKYGFIDEERKVNINRVDQIVLRSLFRNVLSFDDIKSQDLAASIVDWRDGDSELSIPIGSAEDLDYSFLKYSYEAKDSPFEVLEEILLVKGMTQEIFEKLKGYITIYGEGEININTANKNVLLAFGLDKKIVDNIIKVRAGLDGVERTLDDNIFDSTVGVIETLNQFITLGDKQTVQLNKFVDHYAVSVSNNFTIRSVSKLENKNNKLEVIAVINRKGNILYWKES